MFKSMRFLAIVFLAAGALLGYSAAVWSVSFFQKAAAVPPAPVEAAAASAQAEEKEEAITFEVRVPADALLEVDGDKTKETGEVRFFKTPPLRVGGRYHYALKATAGGKVVTREIHLSHGAVNAIDLRGDFQAA